MADTSEWGPQRHNFTEELLTVLYVLERMAQGTTLNQLIEIMDETTEINYFDYRNALEHLLERKLIFSYPSQTGERYILSISGRQSLAHFVPMIKGSVRDRIDAYIKDNRTAFRQDNEILTYRSCIADNSYIVFMRAFDDDQCVLELALPAGSAQEARALEENMKKKAGFISKAVIEVLAAEQPGAPEI